jgi:hypothetical protein
VNPQVAWLAQRTIRAGTSTIATNNKMATSAGLFSRGSIPVKPDRTLPGHPEPISYHKNILTTKTAATTKRTEVTACRQ